MTSTSTGAFVDSSFKPSCCWNAVNKSGGASGSGAAGGGVRTGARAADLSLRRVGGPFQGEVIPCRTQVGLIDHRPIENVCLQHPSEFRHRRIANVEIARRAAKARKY